MDEKERTQREETPLHSAKAREAEDRIVQMIVFILEDEEFGADIDQVREIIARGAITPIPDSPHFIKGMTNVRGEIAVVIDLKNRFFLHSNKGTEEKHIIIMEQDKNLFGLMVDEVIEVLRIPQSEIKTTPELVTKIDRAYISGIITKKDRLIMMLNLTKVLSEEELARLSEIHTRHRHSMERSGDQAERKEAEEAETGGAPVKVGSAKAPKQPKREKRGGSNA